MGGGWGGVLASNWGYLESQGGRKGIPGLASCWERPQLASALAREATPGTSVFPSVK